jgi:trigger factor
MPDISVVKTGEDAASKSLQVTVPEELVAQAEARAVKYYGQRARVPGFRPGKAPEAVVRRRFGEAIRQTVLQDLIRESWDLALKSETLKPIAEPHIHNLSFEAGGPIQFEFHVEVKPDISLKRMGGFKLTRKVAPVTDEAVEERLRELQEQRATWLPVEAEKPKPGQLVRLEVTSLEGEGPAQPQPYSMVLGEGRTIPDVEERVMTLLPGESVEAEVKFPDDHPDESRRGKSRKVRIALHEVKRKELPALDDGLARELGDFEDLAALRKAVREDLEKDAQAEADSSLRRELVQQIAQANQVPAPPSLVERLGRGYAEAYGVPPERLPAFTQEFRPIAESQVRRELILDAVAEANQLKATAAELDERIARLAGTRNLPPAQVYAQLEKANRLGELEKSVTEEKVFAWLLSQSTVEEGGS